MSLFNPGQWAADHFEHANLGDTRRVDRLIRIASQMASGSGKSLAQTCLGDESKLETRSVENSIKIE